MILISKIKSGIPLKKNHSLRLNGLGLMPLKIKHPHGAIIIIYPIMEEIAFAMGENMASSIIGML